MRIFALILLFVCGCENASQPTPPKKKIDADKIYPVNPVSIARSRTSAEAYDGFRVSIKISVHDFSVTGDELHIPATMPKSPPLIVVRPVHPIPKDTAVLVAVGRCRIVDDGIRRSAFCDFGILIECEYIRTFSGWVESP